MTIVAHTVCSQTRDSQIAEETKRQEIQGFIISVTYETYLFKL